MGLWKYLWIFQGKRLKKGYETPEQAMEWITSMNPNLSKDQIFQTMLPSVFMSELCKKILEKEQSKEEEQEKILAQHCFAE